MKEKNKWISFIFIIIGNLLVAASVSFFILPNDILTGGVAGVVVALNPLIHMDSVLMINIITYALFILGAILLGKGFALRTLLSTLVYPLGVSIFSYIYNYFPEGTFIMEPYLASIYSGLISGVGLGLCFRVNASTGGINTHLYLQETALPLWMY